MMGQDERERLLKELDDVALKIKARPLRRIESSKEPEELIDIARKQLAKLTKLPIHSVIGVSKTEEGWVISLEVLEGSSPIGEDVLGLYDVRLDDYGDFLGFQRKTLRKCDKGQ